MNEEASIVTARDIMLEFADATGLSAAGTPPRRYLWTDAYAVCTFLTLYRRTGDERFKLLALRLVEQVHNILGQHRDDDQRRGWISSLDDREGEAHPTVGGLRIGKSLNERKPSDPFDERLEWDRDGQYYHYLTKWMQALNHVGTVTGDTTFYRWAIELAKTAHARFTYRPSAGGRKRMYWKMSIDLSRPLVPSMGQHDPLDGLITYNELQTAGRNEHKKPADLDLSEEISDMGDIRSGVSWETDDSLGIGGLLTDAYRIARLMAQGYGKGRKLLDDVLSSAQSGMDSFLRHDPFAVPAEHRLAFREFGLSIGLHAVGKLEGLVEAHPDAFMDVPVLLATIESLMSYERLIETIETFWLEPEHAGTECWLEHRDINMVMLATSLVSGGRPPAVVRRATERREEFA